MQLFYFPYISLKKVDEIKFPDLNAKVWNFDRKATDYIPNQTLRIQICRILAINMRGPDRVQDIGILSIGDVDFRAFGQSEIEVARQVRLRLFLAFSAKNNTLQRSANTGSFMATAENFSFVIQNFTVGNEHIAESAGAIVTLTAGGYTIDELTFQAPGYIITPIQFRLDESMLGALAEMKQKRPRVYDRMLLATDFLFRSYFNDPYVDINSRILLCTVAFEVLLDLPDDNQQRRKFKEAIAQYLNLPDEKTVTYWSERGRGRKAKEHETMKVKWADRLYVLRSHTIHGNKVRPVEYSFEGKQRHIDISMLFFIALLRAKINKSLRRKIFLNRIKWSKYIDNNDGGVECEGFEFDDRWSIR